MFNFTIKIAVSVLFMFQLIGCGGSGGGSDQAVVTVDDTLTDEETQVLIDAAKVEMGQLVADEAFEFTNKQQINVALDLTDELALNNQTGQRAYVSIYRDYQLLASNEFYPDASSRVIAGELQNGLFNHVFTNLDDQSDYLIEVWFYDGEKPIQQEKSIISAGLIW